MKLTPEHRKIAEETFARKGGGNFIAFDAAIESIPERAAERFVVTEEMAERFEDSFIKLQQRSTYYLEDYKDALQDFVDASFNNRVQAQDDGWVEHKGGGMPCPSDTLVQYKCLGYITDQVVKAGALAWEWDYVSEDYKITKWRYAKPPVSDLEKGAMQGDLDDLRQKLEASEQILRTVNNDRAEDLAYLEEQCFLRGLNPDKVKGDGVVGQPMGVRELVDYLVNSTTTCLRLIAEMSEKVPEGCVRAFFGKQFSADHDSPLQQKRGDESDGVNPATHFIDILLPSPMDSEQQEFEACTRSRKFYNESDFEFSHGQYKTPSLQHNWNTWQAARNPKTKGV